MKFKLSRYQKENLVFDKYIVDIALNLMTDELEERCKAKRELAKGLSPTGLQDIDANDIIADNITTSSKLSVSGTTNLNNSLNV
jgi:hypothetical protein